jgi:Ca-activated chloride channel family protein
LTGHVKGERKVFQYTLDFPEYSQDDKASFVPRLWAGRKVDFLLGEIRKQSTKPQKELVDEVTYLAKRYGIVTPYTSFLVTDDVAGKATGKPGSGGSGGFTPMPVLRRQLEARVKAGAQAPQGEDAKRDRFKTARSVGQFRRGATKGRLGNFDKAADEALGKDGNGKMKSSLTVLRYIGSRTFYKGGATWYDSTYDAAKHKDLTKVAVGSKPYFDLLAADGSIAKYLALGDVVLPVKGKWYHIAAAKK